MSALDANVGAFIMEETIIKELRAKTVVLVTHGLQYLKSANYIYVVDGGEIVEEGSFEKIKSTELYQKFRELEQVAKKIQFFIKNQKHEKISKLTNLNFSGAKRSNRTRSQHPRPQS